MPRKLEEFLSDPTDPEKELTRKLYWAVSSTVPLQNAQKASTFSWCAQLATRILSRVESIPPPALRSNQSSRTSVDPKGKNGYASMAGGGAAGSLDKRHRQGPSSKRMRSGAVTPRSIPRVTPAELEEFKDRQARLKAAAIVYMAEQSIKLGIN